MVLYKASIDAPDNKTDPISNLIIEDNQSLETLKSDIMALFKAYMIDPASLVFMPMDEFEKRSKMADKFALSVMRNSGN